MGIPYQMHTYDAGGEIDGISVAAKVGIDPKYVYKTLVTQGKSKNYFVFGNNEYKVIFACHAGQKQKLLCIRYSRCRRAQLKSRGGGRRRKERGNAPCQRLACSDRLYSRRVQSRRDEKAIYHRYRPKRRVA